MSLGHICKELNAVAGNVVGVLYHKLFIAEVEVCHCLCASGHLMTGTDCSCSCGGKVERCVVCAFH